MKKILLSIKFNYFYFTYETKIYTNNQHKTRNQMTSAKNLPRTLKERDEDKDYFSIK